MTCSKIYQEPRKTKHYKNYRTTHTPHKPSVKRISRHKIVYIPRKTATAREVIDKLNARGVRWAYYFDIWSNKNYRYHVIDVARSTYRINGETLYYADVDYTIEQPKKHNVSDDKGKVIEFTINGYKSENYAKSEPLRMDYKLKGDRYIRIN